MALAGSLLVGVASLATLRELPYSTSLIFPVAAADAELPPGDSFSLGPLEWNLERYRTAPTLELFRTEFSAACGPLNGLQAARCVVDIVKQRSPRGEPRHEFIDSSFDPAGVLAAHLAGAPGHCMSRSFMVTTALLAMGKPARIVQLLPADAPGHNVVEVWDPGDGWILFDPYFDSSFLKGDEFVSAVELSQTNDHIRWRRLHDDSPNPDVFVASTINVPDPWLYTRVGAPLAPWPFRGFFVQFGATQFRIGPAQKLALLLALVSALVGLGVCVSWLRSWLRARSERPSL